MGSLGRRSLPHVPAYTLWLMLILAAPAHALEFKSELGEISGSFVATISVIALGVGGRCRLRHLPLERAKHQMEHYGHAVRQAFYEALRQRGTAAVFTAVTMSIGVGSWAFSALKFQSDVMILLAVMFLVNMLGAVFVLPAVAALLMRPRTNATPQAALKPAD